MIDILVVDDHPVVREGLVAMLGTQQDMRVVAEAGTGQDALALVSRCNPDVVLIDLQLPDTDGANVIEIIKAQQPQISVLVLTAFVTDDRVLHAVRAGAQGYLLKGVPKDELFHAIRTIHQGGSLLGPGIAAKLLSKVRSGSMASSSTDRLSERELSVLRLVADGARNKQIAGTLSITERTVKFHLNVIFQKLNATSRTEAVKIAAQRGMIRI